MRHIFDWTSISHDAFEDLALEYVDDNFPIQGGRWTATPKSNDGNRDGEAVFRHKLGNEITENLFWCEAKYIQNVKSNLKKCRLDQTLISAFFESSLRRIIFVTNGYFSESSKLRARRFSDQARLDKPLFIDEPRVSDWLTKRKDVVQKFGIISVGKTCAENIEIIDVRVLLKRDYKKGIWAPIRQLAIDNDYIVLLSLKSSIQTSCTIQCKFPSHSVADQLFNLSVGDNILTYEFNPDVIFEAQPIEVQLRHENGRLPIHYFSPTISASSEGRFEIVCKSQAHVIQTISDILRKSNTGSANGLIYIQGPGGAGKSRALDEIAIELEGELDVEVFAFDGKKGNDSETIANLIQYLNFGFIYKEINKVAPSAGFYYNKLLNLFNSGHGLIKNKGPFGEQKIAIVDDIHKSTLDTATLLKQLLQEHNDTKNNTILICAAREGTFLDGELENSIEKLASRSFTISLLTKNDIDRSIKINFPKSHYFQLCESVSNLTSTIHDLESFFYTLSAQIKKQVDTTLDIPSLYSKSLGERAFFSSYGNMSSAQRVLTHFMYIAERGIELDFVLAHVAEVELDNLITKKILKFTTTSGERQVRYWHDIKLEHYKNIVHQYDMPSLIKVIEDYVAIKKEAWVDFFHFLIKYHPQTRLKRIHDAIELKDTFIGKGDFGKATRISNVLVELLCEDEGYIKYGITYDTVLKTKHDHAMCLAHNRSSEEAKALYQSIIDDPKADLASNVTISVVNRSYSEIFNVMLRELRIKEIISESNKYTKNNHDNMFGIHGELYRRPVLDSYNRLMMALFLSDRIEEANKIFTKGTALCEVMGRTKDLAGFHLDKAKSLLHANPWKSINLIFEAIKYYQLTNESKRRMLVAQCELAYARLLIGEGSLAELEKTGRDMLAAKYYRGYVRTRYKCFAYHLVNSDFAQCENELKKCSHPALIDNSERLQLIRHHLYSLFFVRMGCLQQAQVHANEHFRLVKGVGISYVQVAKNNMNMIRISSDAPLHWSHTESIKPTFLIDNRI